MGPLRFAFVFSLAFASVIAARPGDAAAEAPGTVRYTVAAGDTCAAIALRHYGDARHVDLIHAGNPGMGPPPHALRAGEVLLLPPKPAELPPQPDARLTRTRNRVEVQAPEPREGKVNDPLFRGNRVGTKVDANADVTFRDETQVKLGENTLVVIFGDDKARAARLDAAETTLVTGSLRSRLAELTGKGAPQPRIATAGASVALKAGEAQVSVDEKQTTRVAVYKGATTLSAQRKAVDVADGFGSKADLGSPPTPPAPLPPAPAWVRPIPDLFVSTSPVSDFALAFAATPGTPLAREWHVQLGRDPELADIVVDARVPREVLQVVAKNAPAGVYYARVSAIDADRFEGKWSAIAKATVVALAERPLGGRRTALTVAPADVRCEVGSGARGALELDRAFAQLVTCVAPSGELGSVTFARIDGEPAGGGRKDTTPIARPAAPAASDRIALELAGGARAMTIAGTDGPAFGGGASARLALPFRRGVVLIGADTSIDRIVSSGGESETGAKLTRARGDVWAGGVVMGLRFGGPRARWAPYLVFGPQLVHASLGADVSGVATDGSVTTSAVTAAAGADVRLMPRLSGFAEVMGRQTIRGESTGAALDVSGVGLSIGLRVVAGAR